MFTNRPILTKYQLPLPTLPRGFEGFSITLISDLHGQVADSLLSLLRRSRPELIAITGDLVDSRRQELQAALAFVRETASIAPCYYAPGNHESRLPQYPALVSQLQQAGVTLLDDREILLSRDGSHIRLLGLLDPAFPGGMERVQRVLETAGRNQDFQLLLSHRPELFPLYARNGFDLILSGHAHGGQVRIPGVGGLYAPGQGLFPKWDGGVYTQWGSTLVVSRGLGNSAAPLRICNPPELVSLTLVRR